jgi:hypothetical protein
MSEWKPIETAPKDESTVIVYCQVSEMVGTAYFDVRLIQGIYKWAWYWCWSDPDEESDCYPTHWMPLPSPPDAL